jgi:hypothetical protein
MKNIFVILILSVFLKSCGNSQNKSGVEISDIDRNFLPMAGIDEFSAIKYALKIYDSNRSPLFRIWVFRWTAVERRVFESRMFEISNFRSRNYAAMYSCDLRSIDTMYKVENRKQKEYFPKSGWEKMNSKLKANEVWNIPRFLPFQGDSSKQYPMQSIDIEFNLDREYYRLNLAGITNLHELKDKKAMAVMNLFRIINEEFGIDLLNFDFDEK